VIQAETIDDYVKNSQKSLLWVNSTCGYVEAVPNFDANKMLENAFKTVSFDEGKPQKWKILEHKKSNIHGKDYYLIRFIAFNKERIFVFNLDVGDGRWCVR